MATSTRPGIAFAVQYLCRCLSGTWPDSDPLRAEWLHATIVKYRLRVRSEYKYSLHYRDVDGEDFAWDRREDSTILMAQTARCFVGTAVVRERRAVYLPAMHTCVSCRCVLECAERVISSVYSVLYDQTVLVIRSLIRR